MLDRRKILFKFDSAMATAKTPCLSLTWKEEQMPITPFDPFDGLLGEVVEEMEEGNYRSKRPVKDKNVRNSLEEIRKIVADFNPINGLKPGDVVVWKDDMKNLRWPHYNDPIVVVEVFDEPRRFVGKHASPHWTDRYDFTAGWFDEDGEFVVYAFDSRRFKRIKRAQD